LRTDGADACFAYLFEREEKEKKQYAKRRQWCQGRQGAIRIQGDNA